MSHSTSKQPTLRIEPYLFFEGRCGEAIEFYQKALDAQVVMKMQFKDSPDPTMCAPGLGEKIMHAAVNIGGATVLMSDGRCSSPANFQGFSLSITAPDAGTATRFFNALSEGGQVMMPLGKTFYSPCFGMVTDRFGVLWMLIVMP